MAWLQIKPKVILLVSYAFYFLICNLFNTNLFSNALNIHFR
nr:MAG TPA: hypothetical protein [Microviridae sp.]DAR94421.1 MAG TPA: hypothetical protein [Microviridae sp.]DAX45659.1 MAG TPA: hypothetical protein [Microviridae sp.]